MPPPASSPLKQCENAFGATPCEESCETTDISCCPNPKMPSTARSDFVKSPVCVVLHLFHDPPSKARIPTSNQQKKRIQLLSQAWKTNYSSPKGNGSRRIRGHRPPKNCVKIQQVWYIISRGPTAISILESICTLIVLTRTNSIRRLNSSTASLVWTRDQWSCWRAPSIKEIERNL